MHTKLLSVPLAAIATAANAGPCDFSDVVTRTQQLLQTAGVDNAGIVIGTARGVLFERYFGGYDDTTVVPVASASKLLSGVRIMQLVDRGLVDLDAPVTTYLSEIDASCPLVETYDEIFRDGAEGLP